MDGWWVLVGMVIGAALAPWVVIVLVWITEVFREWRDQGYP